MIVSGTGLPDVWILDVDRRADDRGFFARTFCVDELAAAGIEMTVLQENLSYNTRKGTLRGMHLQRAPHGEPKIVRCVRGAIWDVAVDVRAGSASAGRFHGEELSMENRRALYIPAGFAHGFLTLTDDAEVLYLMGARYVTEMATGYRYDDPAFGIRWPFAPSIVSERDLAFGRFSP